MKKFALLVAVFGAGIFTQSSPAVTVMRDNASDLPYTNLWANGQNGGTGFNPWDLALYPMPGGMGMFFVRSSVSPVDTSHGFDGHPSEPQSWGITVQPGTEAIATRQLGTSPLWPGGSFSVNMKNGPIFGTSSAEIILRSGTQIALHLIYYAPWPNYHIFADSDTDTGVPVTFGGVNVVVTITGTNTYSLALTPFGGATNTFTGAFSPSAKGPIDTIVLDTLSTLDGGQVSTNYFNSLIITSPPPYITCDEDGNGNISGFSMTSSVTNDPGPGGAPQALVYTLPFAASQGDVILLEPGSTNLSDILRFNGDHTLIVYSDPFSLTTNLTDGCDSLADGPGPTSFYNIDHQVTVMEVGPEDGTNGLVYTPTFGQPGYDASNPTYNFISDLPPLAADPFQAWELKYFGCTNCPQAVANADPDGDGMSNTNEFLAGTNPTNAASAFRITSIVRQGASSNDVNITWNAAQCKAYLVQFFPGVAPGGSYSNAFTDLPGSLSFYTGKGEGTLNFVDAGAATNKPSRYYRIRLAQ